MGNWVLGPRCSSYQFEWVHIPLALLEGWPVVRRFVSKSETIVYKANFLDSGRPDNTNHHIRLMEPVQA